MALEYTEEKLSSLDKETVIQLFLVQQEQLKQIDRTLQLVLEQVVEYSCAMGSSAIIRFCCFSYISILPLVTAYHNDHTSTFLSFVICC